jgi:predicted transposase YdaD
LNINLEGKEEGRNEGGKEGRKEGKKSNHNTFIAPDIIQQTSANYNQQPIFENKVLLEHNYVHSFTYVL